MTRALESNRNLLAAADLSRLEAEAGEAEARLDRELVTARCSAEEAAVRLAQLQAAAEQAEQAGQAGPDEELTTLLRNVRPLAAQRFDEADARARLHEARMTALQHRRLATTAVRSTLEAFMSTTAAFAARLEEDQARLTAIRARREATERQADFMASTEESVLEAALLAALPQAPAQDEAPRARRRELPRVAIRAEVDLSSDSNFYGGFSTNISEGGLFIATVMHPPRGAMVDVHLSLPGGPEINARGVVRWTREINDSTPDVMPGAGVQFVDLPAETAQAISDFVSKREPLFYVE